MAHDVKEEYMIDPNEATMEEIQEALRDLAKKRERKDKIAKGEIKGGKKWSEMSDEEKARSMEATKRRNVKVRLLAQKAVDAGITVSEEEVAAAMK